MQPPRRWCPKLTRSLTSSTDSSNLETSLDEDRGLVMAIALFRSTRANTTPNKKASLLSRPLTSSTEFSLLHTDETQPPRNCSLWMKFMA